MSSFLTTIRSTWNNWKAPAFRRVQTRTHYLDSVHLDRMVVIDVYLPPKRLTLSGLPFVLFNDGQDLRGMHLRPRLEQLFQTEQLPYMALVGIHAGDRLREYGTAEQPDHSGRGDMALAYEKFILRELLPYLHERYLLSYDPGHAAVAGFSMGGLSAFDLVWRNPLWFRTAGVFSGALWWRSTPFNPMHPDADRIVHTTVLRTDYRPGLRFWFQTGTEDETADRNNNGVIDAIDDTLHLMHVLEAKGYQPDVDMTYVEVPGGRHEPATWSEVLPDFLRWFAQGVKQ